MNSTFTVYKRPTRYPGGYDFEHVFLASAEGNNWNCFGTGTESLSDGKSKVLTTASALTKWAAGIYGPYEGHQDAASPAAGLLNRYSGVCHTAANRLLVLAGDDVDVRGASGNALAILMYGKFGFDLDGYLAAVKTAGAAAGVSDTDIQTVLSRITRDLSPDEEISILEADLNEQLAPHLQRMDANKQTQFRAIYTDFQQRRKTTFDGLSAQRNNANFFDLYAGAMKPVAADCFQKIVALLGLDDFKAMFGLDPAAATKWLIG